MKKLTLLVCIIAITFSSVSCIGWESGVVSTKADQSVNTKTTKIQARINQVSMQKWKENNKIFAHVVVEIENIGRERFKIDSIKLTFISKEGEILKKPDCDKIDVSYYRMYIIQNRFYPGDVGYAEGTYRFDSITNPEVIAKAEVTVYYTQTLRTKKEILVKNIEIEPYNSEPSINPSCSRISAKVSVLNNNNASIKDYRVCVILYDENNQILGALTSNYYNADYALKPGESEPFTLYSGIKFDIVYPKIKATKGFCWTYLLK